MINDKYILRQPAVLYHAIEAINALSGGSMTLFVVDGSGRLSGTVTDGDIRRAIIKGVAITDDITKVQNTRYKAIRGSVDDVAKLKEWRQRGISLIPRLDEQNHIVDIIDLTRTSTLLPLRAVLMAGGQGERLRPLTLKTPKPLLQIEGKAIIDYNIEALAACGISDINVSVKYLAEQIEEHFASAVAGVKVNCFREDKPLGTIGAVGLLSKPENTDKTLVMNSDLLTTISYEDLYLHHQQRQADITIAVVPYQVSVPFAILDIDADDHVRGLSEKPCYSYYANAGIYLFNDQWLSLLAPDTRTDAPDLIERAIAQGAKVSYFPINGTWIDVGTPTDFRHAADLMRHHKNMTN